VVSEEEGFGTGPLHLEFRLRLDIHRFAEGVNLKPEEIEVAMMLYNDASRRHCVMDRWDLSRVPIEVEKDLAGDTYGPQEVVLGLVAYLRRDLKPSLTHAWRKGSILSERSYKLIVPTAQTLFQVDWTAFEARGWPADALWSIEMMGLEDSYDSSSEDLIKVHLNKDLPALVDLFSAAALRRPASSAAARVLRPVVVAGILADVSVEVLRTLNTLGTKKEDLEERSLAARVMSVLEGQGLTMPQALSLADEESHLLRRAIQGAVGVGKAYDERMFERLRVR
jgi:hypothetical protein